MELDSLGEDYKGYVVKITGGSDLQGFPMMQGILVPHRVRLLFNKNHKCYHPRKDGERRRKSVRGCIVGPDLSVLSMIVVKTGEKHIEGLTDKTIPRRLGPKRANKIRKLFNLTKEDDVCSHVVRREIKPKKEGGKVKSRAPKIQRLITPVRLQRKRKLLATKKARIEKSNAAAAEYKDLLAKRSAERKMGGAQKA